MADSIIPGVTEVINKFERIIVLEDDLVTAPYFLNYMNDALNKYKKIEKVMHIAGYMYPIEGKDFPQTFFYRPASCWGWATWKRAWDHFDPDLKSRVGQFTPAMKNEFNMGGVYNDYWNHVELNLKGRIHTWAIKWYFSVFLKDGLCLHPTKSLVENIGHDGTGAHCVKTQKYCNRTLAGEITEFEDIVAENPMVVERIKQYLLNSQPWPHRISRIIKKAFL
ncbi:MAG: hypothetical protein P1P89_16675 [Desulfobacterales bacterium]|nr:hypothetical protein [Desulfobacterales bacterium]